MKLSRPAAWLAAILLAMGVLTCSRDPVEPRSEAAAMKAVAGDGQTAPVGTVLPVPLAVLVTDASGKPVAGVAVSWEALGGGSVSSASVETDAEGRSSVERTVGGTAGPATTLATVDGLAGSPVTFTATASPAGSESMGLVTLPPTSALDKEVFAPEQQPSVKVLDADGQPEAGREVTVSIGSGGGTVQGQTTATTDAQGVAVFGDLGISGTGTQTLAFVSGALSVQSAAITVSALPSEATSGKWGPVIGWADAGADIVPLHMHLLSTGNILAWGRGGQPYLWRPPVDADPAGAGTFTEMPVDTMLFCAGHAFMPDGRLMVSGGHLRDDRGLQVTHFFTAEGNSGNWDNAGGAMMAVGRWYPTVTILPDGQVLTMAGRDSTDTVVAIPELWTGSQWIQLTGINKKLPYYPRNFVEPKHGYVFYAGEQVQTWYFDVNTVVSGKRGVTMSGPSHVWPYNRDYGSAVMYDDGKIMYVGGGGDPNTNNPHSTTSSTPTNTAEVIDLNATSPAWVFTDGAMAFPRRHLNATVLPNKQVLVTGGVSGGGFNDLGSPVQAAEVWTPATDRWTTLASSARPRGYHAVSLLLPSGQVLHGASGDANVPVGLPNAGAPFPRETNHEIFSPPYLFKGNRPTIVSAPATVGYSQTFEVETPYAAQITQVTWIRLASVTHAFDQSGRLNTLSFTRTATGLSVGTPSGPTKAPPGHYMLFIMNRNGVPSVGRIIRIS